MTIHSTCLPSGRRVTVYTPPGHDREAAEPCPLLVLHDGQNLFEGDRSYVPGGHWRVGETADDLIERGRIPPMVIAGIDHAGPDRVFEFTPTRGARGLGGGAADYAGLIIDEALPFLRREYAVTSNPAMTGLGGSSLGGLVTLFIAASYPDAFGKLLVMSPSVWWDHREILRILVAGSGRPEFIEGRTLDVWLDIGLREGESTIRDARRLQRVLRRLAEPLRMHYLEEAEGDHSERAWARRFPEALEFLFGPVQTSAQSHALFGRSEMT